MNQKFKLMTHYAADAPVAPHARPLLQSQKNRKR